MVPEAFHKNKPIVPIPCKHVQDVFSEKCEFRQIKMIMKIQEFTVDLVRKKDHRNISNV